VYQVEAIQIGHKEQKQNSIKLSSLWGHLLPLPSWSQGQNDIPSGQFCPLPWCVSHAELSHVCSVWSVCVRLRVCGSVQPAAAVARLPPAALHGLRGLWAPQPAGVDVHPHQRPHRNRSLRVPLALVSTRLVIYPAPKILAPNRHDKYLDDFQSSAWSVLFQRKNLTSDHLLTGTCGRGCVNSHLHKDG